MADLEFYRTSGLYDPESPTAAEEEALLHWLEQVGWEPASIVSAWGECGLAQVAGDAMVGPTPEFALAEVAEQLEMTVADLDDLRRTAGLAPRGRGVRAFSKAQVEALRGLQQGKAMFTVEEANHFARVLGSSLARIADAAVSLFLIDVEGPLRQAGGTEFDVARQNIRAIGALDGVASALDPLFRLHMEDAIARSRESRDPGDDPHITHMAVGFVDLVGFTAFSEQSTAAEIGRMVRQFEDRAYDIVADNGGRVVKLIGDEVMFVAVEADVACRVAIALIRQFDDDRVTPRGGIAYGELLTRGGDYYGPIVNLASRIGDLAVPCEVLATPEVAARCPDVSFEPAGRRQLKGFGDPVELVSIMCD